VVVLVHGSRGERAKSEIPEILRRVTEGLKTLLFQEVDIVGAALQFNHPNLEEASEALIERGASLIVVAPYFLFFGRHLAEDIPETIQSLNKIHPGVDFTMTENLGLNEYFIELIARRITAVCPGLQPEAAFYSNSPKLIEKHSMQIVESLLPANLAGKEREVIKRMVHASGDPLISTLVRYSPTAIASGIDSVHRGCSLFTDVRMVAAGINKSLLRASGCSIYCALDEAAMESVEEETGTRSANAMKALGKRLDRSIVAIGNAPTALLALLEMIDEKQVIPALVVGMPVGFVQAAESKTELMKRSVPYITIEGTRGGSPLAASAVNALLKLGQEPQIASLAAGQG
jgi:precorrin-8X/cobalt-precorrin-8 methylmutase